MTKSHISRRTTELIILFGSTAGAVIVAIFLLAGPSNATRTGAGRTLLTISITVGGGIAALTLVTWVFVQYNAVKYNRLRANAQQLAAQTPVSNKDTVWDGRIPALLDEAARDVAAQLDVDSDLVRAALFFPMGEALRIPPGLAFNFPDPGEAEIAIPSGEGSAGRAFKNGRQNIAIYHHAQSDSSISKKSERQKVHPDLKWIVSTPIFGARNEVVGVLNVDGLSREKPLRQLEDSANVLIYWAELAGLLLGISETDKDRRIA